MMRILRLHTDLRLLSRHGLAPLAGMQAAPAKLLVVPALVSIGAIEELSYGTNAHLIIVVSRKHMIDRPRLLARLQRSVAGGGDETHAILSRGP